MSYFFYSLTIFCSFKVQLYVCSKHVIMCVIVCIFIFDKTLSKIRVDFFLSMTCCVNHISYPCALVLFCNTFCIPFIEESYSLANIFSLVYWYLLGIFHIEIVWVIFNIYIFLSKWKQGLVVLCGINILTIDMFSWRDICRLLKYDKNLLNLNCKQIIISNTNICWQNFSIL